MKNNLAIQTNSSEQEDSSLSVAYKKTTHADNVVSELEITTTETINPASRQRGSKKKTEKFYRQLVPVKIYDELPVLEDAIRPYIKGYKTVYLLEMISIIAWHIRKDDGVARLQMDFLKKQVPQGDKYMKGLISNKIVIRTGQPIKGDKCYEYSFTPKYQSKYIEVPLVDMKLVRRLDLLYSKIERENTKKNLGTFKTERISKTNYH